jgi:tetratricopeptide (TPR) repeat protein
MTAGVPRPDHYALLALHHDSRYHAAMRMFGQQTAAAEKGRAGRNDPCPCGSGRKYKNCCAGKSGTAAPARPAPGSPARSVPELQRISELREAGRFVEAVRLAEAYTARYPKDTAGHSELGMVHLYAGNANDALPCFMQAVSLAPNVAENHHNAGWALEQLGRDGEAITALRRATAIDPNHVLAHERLGILLMNHDRREQAFDCFRRVVAVEPDSVMGRLTHARLVFESGHRAEGEQIIRQAAVLHPTNVDIRRSLASILRERGEFEEAIPLLEQATQGSPLQAATAYFDLSMSKRITEDDQPMLRQMLALLDYRPLADVGRQRVHYGLGKAYDDLRDYAAAMRHYDAANRIAGRNRPFDRAHFGASVQRVITSTTATVFEAHRAVGSASELPVMILGMPRSGTTLVEQIVSSHSEVAGGDELTFWNHTAEEFACLGEAGMTPSYFARVAADYEGLLRGVSPTARRVTDKMPGNYLWIGLIHLVFPKARIIHCRRHPVDTCLSNYFANFRSPMPFTYSKAHLAFYYRCYERMMAHWREVLPPDVMLEVDYEELVADRERMTRRMIDFIGLEWSDACLRPEDNQRAVKTASMWQARQPTYTTSVERWRRYEPWLGELRELLDDRNADARKQPASDNAQIAAGRRLRAAGRLDEALSVLKEALRQSPFDPVLYSEVGVVCLQSNQVALAADCFERAIGLCPHFATAHYNLGAALERLGRPGDAVIAHRQAIALSPTMGQAYSRLGNLLQAQGEQDEALECFRRAKEFLANPTEQDLEEAKLLLAEGRHADAEPKLRAVIEADPANSLPYALLGDVLGEVGQFDEAIAMLRKATELDPDRVGAWHNLIVLKKISADDRPLVEHIESMLQEPGRTESDRILLNFALGKARNDLGQYAKAIGHFDEGNRREHARQPFDRDAFVTIVDQLIDAFTPEFFVRHASLGTASEVPLLVLGMPRSGTTLVEQIVSAHGRVGAGGELRFWSEQAARQAKGPLTADMAPDMARDYLALLRRIAPEAARVTDKDPFNFLRIGLIHLALPKARFIHCRRQPIDICLSIYFTRFATSHPFAYDRGDLAFYYRQYERVMAHWRKVLPADRLLEVDYEALTADPEQHTRRLIAYAGLDWDDACLTPEHNQRVVRTASIWQARQPVYRTSVERWRNYEPWLGELASLRSGEA